MKLISEAPENRYTIFNYQGITIFIDDNDQREAEHAKAFCKKHGYLIQSNQPSAIYYLTGRLKQINRSKVLKGVLEAKTLPSELNEIIHCLTFWNQEGEACYKMKGEDFDGYEDRYPITEQNVATVKPAEDSSNADW